MPVSPSDAGIHNHMEAGEQMHEDDLETRLWANREVHGQEGLSDGMAAEICGNEPKDEEGEGERGGEGEGDGEGKEKEIQEREKKREKREGKFRGLRRRGG